MFIFFFLTFLLLSKFDKSSDVTIRETQFPVGGGGGFILGLYLELLKTLRDRF